MKKVQVPTFVKWAGGKIQLLDQFEKYLPKRINRYFEPFVGSGAVFFYVKQTREPRYSMISDNNPDLINLYKDVKENLKALVPLLKKYKKEHLKNPGEYFYKQRKKLDVRNLSFWN